MNKGEVRDKLEYAKSLFFVLLQSGYDFIETAEDVNITCGVPDRDRARFSRLRKELRQVLLEIDNNFFNRS